MRGAWHLIGLAIWFSQSGVGYAEPATFAIDDAGRAERYEQGVGCFEPENGGGWRLWISWADGVPCKPGSKARAHAVAVLDDLECTSERCWLPRPGTTFRSTLAIELIRVPDRVTVRVQASINVLRHAPPHLFLAVETFDRELGVSTSGVIRVKLYKKLADKIDPSSWRPEIFAPEIVDDEPDP